MVRRTCTSLLFASLLSAPAFACAGDEATLFACQTQDEKHAIQLCGVRDDAAGGYQSLRYIYGTEETDELVYPEDRREGPARMGFAHHFARNGYNWMLRFDNGDYRYKVFFAAQPEDDDPDTIIGPDAGAVPIRAYRSFHPTQSGHDQTGSAVAAMIRELDWGRLERTDGAVDRSAFEGYWSGTIVGPGGTEFEADVQLEIGTEGLVGTIVHPDLPCRGTMMEVSGAGSEVLFETNYTDESDCIQGGTHRLTTVSTDEL